VREKEGREEGKGEEEEREGRGRGREGETDLLIRYRAVERAAPVHNALCAVDQPCVIQPYEGFQHSTREILLE
jgi:hypothetical protein